MNVGVLILAALLPACATSPSSPTTITTTTTTTSTTTTTTTTTTVTETFDGTLSGGSINYHTFHALLGTVTTTLVSVSPSDFAPSIGLGVGTWDGNSCTMIIANTSAKAGTVLVGTATTELDLCVQVFDTGNIAPNYVLSYEVTVVHQGTT